MSEEKSFSSQESDGRNFSFYLTKMENELFDDAKYQANTLWNIKRKNSKKNGLSWIIMKDKKVILEIFERQLNKKDIKFLDDNIILLLSWAKQGLNSVSKLKELIKLHSKGP